VWERIRSKASAEERAGQAPDVVLAALGPGWRRVRDDNYDLYQNFNWMWILRDRRREYERN
jgi:hypothetical protein